MLTSLASDIADPVERLRTISAGMSEAKSQESLIGADLLTDWTEFTFPALIGRAARLISSTRMFDRVRPAFNVTISNIPGPSFPLFLAGARMVGMYPLGPVVEGAGLNITVMSYCGSVYFGLSACREVVPDIADVPAMIVDSLDELMAVVRTTNRGARRPSYSPPRRGAASSFRASQAQPSDSAVRGDPVSPGGSVLNGGAALPTDSAFHGGPAPPTDSASPGGSASDEEDGGIGVGSGAGSSAEGA